MPDGSPWPQISIVTPSYNQGQFLEETIRSVLLQGYPNLEYIIMDGGSTDSSVDIIRKYEPWITYWESNPDRGQSHAINKGFARSTGVIMAWLNSDDVYARGALRLVAEQLAGQNEALLIGSSIITDAPDTLSGKLDTRKPDWPDMMYNVKTFPQPSVFWAADVWHSVGGLDEGLHLLMDYDLWLRMQPNVKQLVFLDDGLSYARSHPQQKSKVDTDSQSVLTQRVQVTLRAARQRGEHPLFWLAKVWARRLRQGFRHRNPAAISAPGFHWHALRAVLNAHGTD